MKIAKTPLVLPALLSVFAIQPAAASVLIDDFQTYQEVINGVDGPVPISAAHTDLNNLERSLSAAANSPYETYVGIDGGSLVVSTNDPGSTSSASVFYAFDSIDFSSMATALLFNVDAKDAGPIGIEFIVNAGSVHAAQMITLAGHYAFDFADFSNPLAFSNVQSLEIKFSGSNAWDAAFSLLATDTRTGSTVPEPNIALLIAIGFAGFAARRQSQSTI